MKRRGHQRTTRVQPAALRESSILAYLERMGETDAPALAAALGLTTDTAQYYCLLLERQGRVATRLETLEEAAARVASRARSVFLRPSRRRRLRYRIAPLGISRVYEQAKADTRYALATSTPGDGDDAR